METVLTFEKQAGDSHPETLEVLLFLGEIQRASGNSASARELYRRVLEGRYEVFGKSPHVEIAEAMRRMGDAERELGNYGVAIDYYRQSDEIYTEVLQENHPDRLDGLYGAGLAAFASGNSQLAKEKARELSDLEFSILEAVLAFTDERPGCGGVEYGWQNPEHEADGPAGSGSDSAARCWIASKDEKSRPTKRFMISPEMIRFAVVMCSAQALAQQCPGSVARADRRAPRSDDKSGMQDNSARSIPQFHCTKRQRRDN
jgi:tetratricopeptide (TPR) repeat protein